MNEYFALLKKRPDFRHLWLASVVSLAGDWFNSIASLIIVNRYTDSGLAVSFVLMARTLPRFFFGPFAGVLADRINRKTIMIASDLIRAGTVLCFLVVDRPERVWLIYALTFLQISVASFFEPASSAMVPSLVEGRSELMTGNVMQSITWSAMLAIGAALGGGVAAWLGAETALVIDAFTFLVSASFLFRIKTPPSTQTAEKSRAGLLGFLDGARYVRQHPQVASLVFVKLMGQIGTGDIIMAVLAEGEFRLGAEGALSLGIMFAASGLGALIGPLLGNHFTDRSEAVLKKLILFGYLLNPIAWFTVSMAPNLWVVSLGFLIRMVGTSINWTYSNVLIQSKVDNNYLGRVFSLDLALFTVASSSSIFLTGYLLDATGIAPLRLTLYFAVACLVPIFAWAATMRSEKQAQQPI